MLDNQQLIESTNDKESWFPGASLKAHSRPWCLSQQPASCGAGSGGLPWKLKHQAEDRTARNEGWRRIHHVWTFPGDAMVRAVTKSLPKRALPRWGDVGAWGRRDSSLETSGRRGKQVAPHSVLTLGHGCLSPQPRGPQAPASPPHPRFPQDQHYLEVAAATG